MNIRDRQILQIALPSIVSNITVPLLGMVDVAIVGHMGSPAYIGAVAVGSMIFNLVYWLFGFLRMGSSGLTSQALGRRDLTEVASILARSVFIAFSIALLLILLQIPMKWASFAFIGPTEDVVPFASTYFNIVIWGAPAVLGLYSMLGWFIGMQNTRFPMFISIMQNVVDRGGGYGNSHSTICRFHRGFRVGGEVLRKIVSGREEGGGRREKCLPQGILTPHSPLLTPHIL